MAYFATQYVKPIPMGAYYDAGVMNLPVVSMGQADMIVAPEGGCPKGYHPGTLESGGVSLQTPVCVKRSFNALHLGIAGLVGFIVGRIL